MPSLPRQKMPCAAGGKWPDRPTDPYPTPTTPQPPMPPGHSGPYLPGCFWHTVWGCWVTIRHGGVPYRVTGKTVEERDEERPASAFTEATMVLYEA
jgi:hypothetical protein